MNELTHREIEVLKLVVEGYSNSVIAKELIVSIHTVKAHLESIYYKLEIHNKVQAAVYAVRNHIVE